MNKIKVFTGTVNEVISNFEAWAAERNGFQPQVFQTNAGDFLIIVFYSDQ